MSDPQDGTPPAAPQQQPRPRSRPRRRPAQAHPQHEPPRAATTRAVTSRPNSSFMAPNQVLRSAKLRNPEGVTFRWEVAAVRGQPVENMLHGAVMAGYRPVRMEDLAEDCPYRIALQLLPNQDGMLRFGGLVGMVIDNQLLAERRAEVQAEVDRNTNAVNRMHAIQEEVRQTSRGSLPTEVVQDEAKIEFGTAAYQNLPGGATR